RSSGRPPSTPSCRPWAWSTTTSPAAPPTPRSRHCGRTSSARR
ncbi:uncharacterized protein METZ01_LOCUS106364, partial [marine metagenome]